jgi:hypothetical protein
VCCTVAAVQVGLAHATRYDPHQCLVGPRIGQFELVDGERAELFVHHGGGNLHDGIRWLGEVRTSARFICNLPFTPSDLADEPPVRITSSTE